jgi:sulfofructose kinase
LGKKWDVLGIGAVAVDDLLFVEQFPLPDSKERVVKLLRQGGGQAGTALVAAARLGVRTAYCGVLGDDELSLFVLEGLTREGVDCELVHKQTGAQPAHGTIIVECSTGRRIVLSYTGKVVEPPSELINEELIASCRVLLVDHLHLNASILAASIARRQGIPVVVDLEVRGNPRLPDLVALADHLIIGINAAQKLTGCEQPGIWLQRWQEPIVNAQW